MRRLLLVIILITANLGIGLAQEGSKVGGTKGIAVAFLDEERLRNTENMGLHVGTIVSIRRVGSGDSLGGQPGIEIQLFSYDEFPVRDEVMVLQIGTRQFFLSGYPNGALNTVVFTLTEEEFAAVSSGEPVILQYGIAPSDEVWQFGNLDKSRTNTVTDNRSPNHVFAQVADGSYTDAGGSSYSYRSTLVVQSDSSKAETCAATLGGGLTIPGFGNGQSLSITLAAGGIAVVDTPGTQKPLKTGYMTLGCSSSVTAQVLYSLRDSSGTVLSEATVFSSPPVTTAQLFADQRNGANLGIAVANASNKPKNLSIVATDKSGVQVGSTTVTVDARKQLAGFLFNFFANVPPDFVGTVRVTEVGGTTADIYAVGLKYTGSAFTTFTTVPVTSRTKFGLLSWEIPKQARLQDNNEKFFCIMRRSLPEPPVPECEPMPWVNAIADSLSCRPTN